MKLSRFPALFSYAVLIFLYAPILLLVLNSFNQSAYSSKWEGFSLIWYKKLFSEREVIEALINSLLIGFASSLIACLLGTLAAFAIDRYKTKLQEFHYALIYAPLVAPEVLTGISLLLFFLTLGMNLGFITIFIAHVTFCLSYVCMVILGRLQDFDRNLLDAAFDLGATPFQATRRVFLPLIAPGIIAGALLSFTLSMDDFVITSFVAGPGSTTLPLRIYSMVKHGYPALLSALSSLIFFATFLSVSLAQRLMNRR